MIPVDALAGSKAARVSTFSFRLLSSVCLLG
jgi:hypothetical protein